MIEGIEKMRNELRGKRGLYLLVPEFFKELDAIEREVEERYIERPVDADGMTISPFDNMVDTNGKKFVVSSIEFLGSGEWLVYANGKLGNAFAKLCHHYKPPTVEDVLKEFASERIDLFFRSPMGLSDEEIKEFQEENGKARDELIAKYAAKLQLKEAE